MELNASNYNEWAAATYVAFVRKNRGEAQIMLSGNSFKNSKRFMEITAKEDVIHN
jgi:hypothetical protein